MAVCGPDDVSWRGGGGGVDGTLVYVRTQLTVSLHKQATS